MNITIHRVYWTEDGEARSTDFDSNGLDACLKYCESLRIARKGGANITHITIASEDSNCTSLQGVSAPPADYSWEKRRGGRK